jgi:hypothetical protein
MAVVTLNIHHMGLRGKDVPKRLKLLVLGWLSHIVFLHFNTDPVEDEGGAKGPDPAKLRVGPLPRPPPRVPCPSPPPPSGP